MNVLARLEYELAYYDSAVHRFNHYTTKTPPHGFEVWSPCPVRTTITTGPLYIYIYIYTREGVAPPPLHIGVVAIEKGAFGLPSTMVANFTYIYIYIYIYIYYVLCVLEVNGRVLHKFIFLIITNTYRIEVTLRSYLHI